MKNQKEVFAIFQIFITKSKHNLVYPFMIFMVYLAIHGI